MTVPSAETLQKLARDHGESFYLFHRDSFRRNWDDFGEAFRRIYPRSRLAYSYKTNYLPAVCRYVDEWGGYAEVVSIFEYELALRLGIDPSRIIFNGPYKRESDLRRAFEGGALVNLDNLAEALAIERIARAHSDLALRVGIRCALPVEGTQTRFGLDVANGSCEEVFRRLRPLHNVRLEGLHCHYMPPGRRPDAYRVITRQLIDLARRVFPHERPGFLDVGGGFFSRMPPDMRAQFGTDLPSFDDYGEAVARPLAETWPGEDGPELILEPGMAVVADSMQFVARVVDIKDASAHSTALLSGSVYNIRPTKSPRNLPASRVPVGSEDGRSVTGPVDLVGYTCMEDDVLHRGFEGGLAVGDFVVFDNVGAYTLVLKPPFILPAPPVLEVDEEMRVLREIRRSETLDDLLCSYRW